jgi:hypothetical protein
MDMERWVGMMILVCVSFACSGQTQKKWDGEAGDSLWNTAKNWYPDGVPLSLDEVLIDNSKVNRSFKILINGTDSVRIQSLSIRPDENFKITVEIPTSNKLPLAFIIQSNSKNIMLGENAFFINSSGASSGNIFSLNGSIYIMNGGTYVHRTLRGNSYVISKLEIDSSNKKGIVEFDVPGNSGYTLSLSGRKFGSLVLSSSQSSKKSYSGSGSSPLLIEGDLIVGENTSFTSSLNASIIINGNLGIKGNVSLSPTIQDSISRDCILGGDSSLISVKGTFSVGNNFKNVVLGAGFMKVESNIEILNSAIRIQPTTSLNLDTFYIKTSKSITIDSFCTLTTAHPEGISTDSSKGCLRASRLNIDSLTSFEFNGLNDQMCGNAIPPSIRSLTVNKIGNVYLEQPLQITDSLKLLKGILKTDSLHTVLFKGKFISGNDSSFINGPLVFEASNLNPMPFPIGKNLRYAPVEVKGSGEKRIKIEYFDNAPKLDSIGIKFPVKTVSQNEYWHIQNLKKDSGNVLYDIRFSNRNNTKDLNGTIYIVRLNDSCQWEMLPLNSNNSVPNTVQTTSTLTSSLYSFGIVHQIALAKQLFQLNNIIQNGKSLLRWEFDSNETTIEYIIEASIEGKKFKNIDSIGTISGNTNESYIKELKDDQKVFSFFRIKAIQKNGTYYYSNIVYIRSVKYYTGVFPNPSNYLIYLSGVSEAVLSLWTIDMSGKKIAVPYKKISDVYEVDVSSLNKGIYRMVIGLKGGFQSQAFIKN